MITQKIHTLLHKLISLVLVLVLIGLVPVKVHASGYKVLDYTSFPDHSITTIHIGSDIYDITSTAFRGMGHLRCITVSENNPFYSSYSGCLYDKMKTELVCYPPALSAAYIPNSVVSIGKNALSGVPEKLRREIIAVVEDNESVNGMEWDVPGAHFLHVYGTVKWIDENGEIVDPPSEPMKMAADLVNYCTTFSMTQSEQLEAAFEQLARSVVYERSTEVPTGDWIASYAMNAMSRHKGNCYGYAAAFAYIARGLGYEAMVCTGTVTSALGGRTPHAWTEVKVGRNWYVFDAEMHRAKGGGYYKDTYETYQAGPINKEAGYPVYY